MNAPTPATPFIVDTDVGGDPDDTIALVLAARLVPELALVLTSDEVDGQRARFARHLLDLAGRPDVPVVAGRQVQADPQFCVGDLIPSTVPAAPTTVVSAVGRVGEASGGKVRWLGIGPLSNLADIVRGEPSWSHRFEVTQMGGALRYRDPTRAEHNFRQDSASARVALAAVAGASLVTSEVTFNPAIEVSAAGPVYRALIDPDADACAGLVRAHLDRWFARFHPGSMQHDALTLSAALGQPFVSFAPMSVVLGQDARMTTGDDGIRLSVSVAADYPAFNRWLLAELAPWRHSQYSSRLVM